MSGNHEMGSIDAVTEFLLRAFRDMSPARKIALVEHANRWARRVALAGIELRYPHASESERFRVLLDEVLGEELAEKAYGPFVLPVEREGDES